MTQFNKGLLSSIGVIWIFCGVRWWIAFRGDKKGHGLLSEWRRLVYIGLATLLFLVLFSATPMRPIKEYRSVCLSPQTDRAVIDVFKIEAEMVGKEISERLKHVDEWFHYKFVLVGALIAAFFTHMVKENIAMDIIALENLLKSSLYCIVVAIACTVAIAVDIHVRNDIIAINQLGSWLAYHAEPHMSGISFENKSILFWEKFIREDAISMHTDQLYRFTFWPHLHFLTWVVYALYLWIFQNMCLTHANSNTSNSWIVLATFGLVHFSLWAFAIMATQSPRQFEFQPIPFVDEWSSPGTMFLLYTTVLLSLVTTSARYTVMLIRTCHACRSHDHKKVVN